jgi:hypothetical protein
MKAIHEREISIFFLEFKHAHHHIIKVIIIISILILLPSFIEVFMMS